jgi:FkbM family methyltransferase
MHHEIFSHFERETVTGTGCHVFDFLGGKTNVKYKSGWQRHAVPEGVTQTPAFPPANEHYFDWIALLESVRRSDKVFRMIELGAGWGPWLVRGFLASRQSGNIDKCELVAVEAEPNHYDWLREHFNENLPGSDSHNLLFGAVSDKRGVLKFPKVHNPSEDYGVSLRSAPSAQELVSVPGFVIEDILGFCSGPVDFLHVDIQGAEYDVLPSNMELLKDHVRAIMIGTHISLEKHKELEEEFNSAGWKCTYSFDRNGSYQTDYGSVQFGDGFLYFLNPNLL